MATAQGYLQSLLGNLRLLREKARLTEAQLEEKLILGPGWIQRFERGETIPSIDMMLAILHATGAGLPELLRDLPEPEPAEVERTVFASQEGKHVVVHFRYANFDAKYTIHESTLDQFEMVVKTPRDGLARLANANQDQTEAIKTDSVARAFLKSIEVWPRANPSDLWWFVIYRAYCDPYNHPARFARLDFTQSWKRTGGWALEEILVRHYGPFLDNHGVKIFIADSPTKRALVKGLKLKHRLEADKIDVVLTGKAKGQQKFFGVVHVKASFAERRTDDVPMSMILTRAGYLSPLWTMDCKSTPGTDPINRGELGNAEGRRSAKRMDIEDEGFFSGCFSYNAHTQPSSSKLSPDRRIYVCDFQNPEDAFSKFILARWKAFR